MLVGLGNLVTLKDKDKDKVTYMASKLLQVPTVDT
jgi:hypothetical protein